VSILRRAYVKVAPDTTDFDRELKERLRLIKADTEGDKLGKDFGTAFTRRFDAQLKSLHISPIDLKANPRDALAAIDKTQRELEGLRDHAGTVELRMRTERALGDLGRFRQRLGDVGDDAGDEAALGFAARFTQRLGPLMASASTAGPGLAVAGGAIGLAMAPTAAAALAAGVVGGAGIGGVVGGLVLASKDARVQAAAKALGDTVMADLNDRAAQFVGPMLDGIAKVRAGFLTLGPDLDRIFASSRFVDPLVTGAVAGARKLVGGVADAVDKADPVIGSLSAGLDRIGAAAGDAFSLLSHDADEGASAVNDLSLAVSNFITVAADIIHVTAVLKGYTDWLDVGIDKARIWVEDNSAVAHALGDVGIQLDLTADGFKKGSVQAEAYQRLVTGVGTAADVTALRLAGMSDADLRRADASGKAVDAANAVTDASTQVGGAMQIEADATETAAEKTQLLAAQQAQLKVVQDAVSASQLTLQGTLDGLGGKTSFASQASVALKQAMDNLYGATINQTDANETYQASWDSLSASVKSNKGSLDIHTVAGRANRDALEGLLTSTNELYTADIAAGDATATATKKHRDRIDAVKEEARRLGLNKTETQKLIDTYGKIPPKKTTDLILDGVREVVRALTRLYIYQRALAEGRSIESMEQKLRTGSDSGPAKRGGGLATGGQVGGYSPSKTADNIPAWLTAREWVHPVDSVDYYGPQIMTAIQKKEVPREVLATFATGALGKLGDLPIFATGGQVAPIDTSRRWPFVTDVSGTYVMTRAQAAAKIPGGPGAAFVRAQNGKPYIWADAGPRGYDCSGIVSAVYNVLHGRNPYSHTFSTASLPGRWFPKPGIGGPLTAAWSNPGEYPASSTTGHMMGLVGGLTFESSGSRGVHIGASTRRLTDFAHRAHYSQGGQVPYASYDAGGYLPPGVSLAYNGTGRPEPVGGGDTFVFNFSGPVASQRAMDDMVVGAVKRAQQSRRLP
jgi:hypothetical protein